MKKMFIAGNWKMNTTATQAKELACSISEAVKQLPDSSIQIAVCPPFTSIQSVGEAIAGSKIILGAQNCHFKDKGAFTGEISLEMLANINCKAVIIGHSERRTYFFETDSLINQKVSAALTAGFLPILCIGETLDERRANQTFEILRRQLDIGLENITLNNPDDLVIAYEPVWAIGTGIAATIEQVEEAHTWLRHYLTGRFDEIGETLAIQYGGSLTAENADDILSIADVNGGLIGGASLKADSFLSIIRFSMKYI
ncbi:MAG: triose-phosphate isomerase [Ignavibacteria bacterium]|nr:triose-phosphate isomerase [Ignavibacteria bacterium]